MVDLPVSRCVRKATLNELADVPVELDVRGVDEDLAAREEQSRALAGEVFRVDDVFDEVQHGDGAHAFGDDDPLPVDVTMKTEIPLLRRGLEVRLTDVERVRLLEQAFPPEGETQVPDASAYVQVAPTLLEFPRTVELERSIHPAVVAVVGLQSFGLNFRFAISS